MVYVFYFLLIIVIFYHLFFYKKINFSLNLNLIYFMPYWLNVLISFFRKFIFMCFSWFASGIFYNESFSNWSKEEIFMFLFVSGFLCVFFYRGVTLWLPIFLFSLYPWN